MSGIFISYRRDDAAGHAGRLFDRLKERFGPDIVFMDVSGIEYGEDFVDAIEKAVGGCDVLLAVIGREWLAIRNSKGERRLDDPNDFVRLEIATALKRKIKVIPVRVEGAGMPAPQDLPDDLQPLTRRHAVELRDARWNADVTDLLEQIGKIITPAKQPESKTTKPRSGFLVAALTLLALAIGVAGALWYQTRTSSKVPEVVKGVAPPNERDLEDGTVFRDTLKDGGEGPEMVVIPTGGFRMGSPSGEAGRRYDEGPQHEVGIVRFALSRFEVSVMEFRRFVAATDYKTAAEIDGGCHVWNGSKWARESSTSWQNPGYAQDDNHPVVCVNWEDAQAYVKWLSEQTGYTYRLPTEAAWEYAARAGTNTARYWGNKPEDACQYANVDDESHACNDGYANSAPVGSFNANAFGLHDMLGNVWEWTQDCWHENYEGSPNDGSAWLESSGGNCGLRVLRGGSWNDVPLYMRSSYRSDFTPGDRYINIGFRLARTILILRIVASRYVAPRIHMDEARVGTTIPQAR